MVEARVTGLTSAVFSATVTADACASATPYTVGSTVNRTLSSADCYLADGSFSDIYGFSVAAAASLSFTLTSRSFDTYLYLWSSPRKRSQPVGWES
jgi:hypothetical protein